MPFNPGQLNWAALSGLASGNSVGEQFGNVNNIIAAQQPGVEAKAAENKTLAYLNQFHPEIAAQVTAGMPMQNALQMVAQAQQPKTPEFKTVGDALYNVQSGEWITPPAGVVTPKMTDDQREYDQAKREGFTGTFMDFQVKMKEAGRNQVNIDTGAKLPTGFRWKDPKNQDLGVDPIPGGPATQIPAELAARIGMAETFKKRLPDIKQKVLAGDTTGPLDVFSGKTMGTNPVYADIQSGVDALQRLLTGAGMNIAEAEQYSRRYMPGYWDDPQTTIQKLERLNEELEAASQKAMLGRGGDIPVKAGEDPLGIR